MLIDDKFGDRPRRWRFPPIREPNIAKKGIAIAAGTNKLFCTSMVDIYLYCIPELRSHNGIYIGDMSEDCLLSAYSIGITKAYERELASCKLFTSCVLSIKQAGQQLHRRFHVISMKHQANTVWLLAVSKSSLTDISPHTSGWRSAPHRLHLSLRFNFQ